MQLTILEPRAESIRAGYTCPCGCQPSVDYVRGMGAVHEGCCCGNEFAVGRAATGSLVTKAGFRLESQAFDAPWGERLEAAWLVGPSVHPPEPAHSHDHDSGGAVATTSIDPVCGMNVTIESARGKGLHSAHEGREYFFCGKGCKLEFDEDPGHYLDPEYVPSM